MKFAIITHAVHKLCNNHIYVYEPYVREMNLWLKYVGEVRIVAPVSTEEVTSIESKYQFQNEEAQRHSESSEVTLSNEKIATSHTPCLPNRQARNDETECHSEQREAISSMEQIATSHTPCLPNRQARNDRLIKIPSFDITSFKNGLSAIFKIPVICFKIYKAMKWADHIHLRCPGNIGLLGCFVQILFPNKPKTIKYAGNWDPKSKQPLSYRLQKQILSNTFLTKNAKVLVYGEWPNQSENIIPFFTASYSEQEIEQVDLERKVKSLRQACTELSRSAQTDNMERHSEQREAILSNEQIATSHTPCLPNRQARNDETERHPEPTYPAGRLVSGSHPNALNFIYVGGLTPGKQPLLSVQVIHQLKEKGHLIKLDMYGEGSEQVYIEKYIEENNLQNEVILHGNVIKEIVKEAYQKSHFLLFISKSEGWPKVVAEAMFWGCLPISSHVSCVPYMLDNGKRGALVGSNAEEIVSVVEDYIKDKESYEKQTKKAMEWSRQYTLEKFEEEIKKLL